MLGFSRARELSPKIGEMDTQLTELMIEMTGGAVAPEDTLTRLLAVSAELETIATRSSFRFGATGAYEAIVNQRIAALRESRFLGRQTFSEFMMRRYEPAMRTVKSTETRLQRLSDRAMRAGELLRTQDLPPIYEENSCIYLFSRQSLEKEGHRMGKNPLMFPIPAEEAWDIDEEIDFQVVDFLMRQRGKA